MHAFVRYSFLRWEWQCEGTPQATPSPGAGHLPPPPTRPVSEALLLALMRWRVPAGTSTPRCSSCERRGSGALREAHRQAAAGGWSGRDLGAGSSRRQLRLRLRLAAPLRQAAGICRSSVGGRSSSSSSCSCMVKEVWAEASGGAWAWQAGWAGGVVAGTSALEVDCLAVRRRAARGEGGQCTRDWGPQPGAGPRPSAALYHSSVAQLPAWLMLSCCSCCLVWANLLNAALSGVGTWQRSILQQARGHPIVCMPVKPKVQA